MFAAQFLQTARLASPLCRPALRPRTTAIPGVATRFYAVPPQQNYPKFPSTRPPQGSKVDEWAFLRHIKSEPRLSASEAWRVKDEAAQAALRMNPPANTYSGRTVTVKAGNVAEAIRKLDAILGRNKVKEELRLQKRHEKRGVKRRRLSSERWRKRFSHEVRKKVQLVNAIHHRSRPRK